MSNPALPKLASFFCSVVVVACVKGPTQSSSLSQETDDSFDLPQAAPLSKRPKLVKKATSRFGPPATFSELDLVRGNDTVAAQWSYHSARKMGEVGEHSIQRQAVFAEARLDRVTTTDLSAYLHVARIVRSDITAHRTRSRATGELGVAKFFRDGSLLGRLGIGSGISGNNVDDYVGSLAASAHRNSDLALMSPGGVTLRTSSTYFWHKGLFNVRIDGGIDQTVDVYGSPGLALQNGYNVQLRLNGGFGIGVPGLAATLQLITNRSLVGTAPIEDDTAIVGAASLEGRRGRFFGRLSGLVPVDERPFTIALGLGYE